MLKEKVIFAIGMVLLGVSCASAQPVNDNQPVTSDDNPVPTPTVDLEKFEIGERALVELAEPVFLESFPLQVQVRVEGNLPDGCTTIHRTESEREGNAFDIRIFTLREKEAMCTQALVPFGVNVPLDVYGLPAGAYQVNVYDIATQFIFEQDNRIDDPGGEG